MYAIIETGGKQYRVQEGDVITVEKLDAKEGDKVVFENVLVLGKGADLEIGSPYVGSVVEGKILENGKGKKVIVYKYKAKKDYRKKQGHRQPFSKVEITALGVAGSVKEEPAKDEPAAEAKEDKEAAVSMSMKKDELIAFAEEKGIEVDAKATKQQIIDTINENL